MGQVQGMQEEISRIRGEIGELKEWRASADRRLQEINDYLIGDGPLLSCLAVFVWTAGVCKDLRQISEFLVAVVSAEKGKTAVGRDEQKYSLQTLSTPRTLVVVLATILRLGVACVLWYAGMLWLTYTVHIPDIILNTVALGFVFDIDELFYNLVPRSMDSFLHSLKPLPIPAMRRRVGIAPWLSRPDARSLSFIFLLFVTVGVWAIAILMPFKQQLQTAELLFCGGDTSFVYAEDKATHAIKTAATLTLEDFEDLDLIDSRAELFRAVLQGVALKAEVLEAEMLRTALSADGKMQRGVSELLRPMPAEALYDERTISEVLQLSIMEESVAINKLQCRDSDDTASTKSGMQKILGHGNCTRLVQEGKCDESQVRAFCPLSCNCTDVHTVMFSRYGCPLQCNPQYQSSLADWKTHWEAIAPQNLGVLSCQDSPDTSQLHTFFTEFQEHLVATGALDGDTHSFTQAFQAAFQRRTSWLSLRNSSRIDIPGLWLEWVNASPQTIELPEGSVGGVNCTFVRYLEILFDTNLCETDVAGGFGTLAPVCPQTCGWCGAPKPQVTMNVMAMDLRRLHGDDVILYEAINLEDQVCSRKGGSSNYSIDRPEAALQDMPNGRWLQVFTFTAQHTGQYNFNARRLLAPAVSADHPWRYWLNMSRWSGFRQLQVAVGYAPCLTSNLSGGEEVVVLVEGFRNHEEETGGFTLAMECPWAPEPREQHCLGNEEYWRISRHEAECSAVDRHQILDDVAGYGYIMLDYLPIANIITGAPYAPFGVSYDPTTRTLYNRGTGLDGARCGEKFNCICTTEEPRFNRIPTACDEGTDGACKACVEDMDPHCAAKGTDGAAAWDQMCADLCTSACSPVCIAANSSTAPDICGGEDDGGDDKCSEWARTTWLCESYFWSNWSACCHCRGG